MPLSWTEAGDGPTLVLLHGFPLDQSVWTQQRAELSPKFRVLTPDLRGHGNSPGFQESTSIDAMADDVISFLDERQIQGPVALGGLSMGGYIAISLAVRYPHRLSALLLIDTRAAADSPEAARNRLALAERTEAENSSEAVAQAFLPRLFAPGTYADQPGIVKATRKVMAATAPATLCACLQAMAVRPDRTGNLPEIEMPTLVIAGAEDPISTPQEAQEIAALLPRSEVAIIPRAGHLACLENPIAVNAAISQFLNHNLTHG